MYLPELNKRNIKKQRVECFEGISSQRVIEEGGFYDTFNLCARFYPALCGIPRRYELDSYELKAAGTPLFFRDEGVCCISPMRSDVPDIYTLYRGENKLLSFEFSEGASLGNIVSFNSKTLFIKSDKAYEYDSSNPSPLTGFFDMGYTLEVTPKHENSDYNERTLSLSVVYEDMTEVGAFGTGTENAEFPNDAEVGDMFARYLEYYRLIYKDNDPSKNIWQPVTSVRLRLDIGDGYRRFKAGDYVRLKDLEYWNWAVRRLSSLNRFVRIDAVDDNKRFLTEPIPVFEGMEKILSVMNYPTNDIGYGDVIINNPGNSLPLLSGSVSGCMPPMDFICTGANRVWGCSNENREIYASELGNARNFSVFEGLSGDSYAVSVGSEGDFTACCNYLGSPVFFKENEMIVVMGSRPQSFTLNSYSVRGVPKHSPDGLCVVGDVLYYMSNDGVYAYNGSSAVCISADLGDRVSTLRCALLFGDADTLYLSALCEDKPVQYTYDIKHRIWHRTDTERVIGYIKYPDTTLSVCYDGEKASLVTLDRGIPAEYPLTGARELDVRWHWESGDLTYSTDKKYLRKLSLDTSCTGQSRLYISYDGEDFMEAGSFGPHKRGSRKITVFPRRCDYFRLRMEGEGDMTLYAITRETEEVSDNG